MALGDIKSPEFKIAYIGKGAGTIAAGDIVSYDASGLIIPATATTLGKTGILSALTHVVGATTYYGVVTEGLVVCKAGGTIKPNDFVVSDANADAVAFDDTYSATVVKAEADNTLRRTGKYIRLESDNQYAASDAANTNLIIVSVGEK